MIRLPKPGGLDSIPCNSVAEAKRVAQEHNDRRILSAITPAPVAGWRSMDRGALMDLMSDSLGSGDHLGLGEAADAIIAYLIHTSAHPDDQAVDRFAAAMKVKLADARSKGRSGWDDPEKCSTSYLVDLLYGHLPKANPGNFEDIANLCMMLHQRGAHPKELSEGVALLTAPVADQPDPVKAAARVLLLEWEDHGEGLQGELVPHSLADEGLVPDIDGAWIKLDDVTAALRALTGEEG